MSWNEPLSAMDMEPIAAELTRLRRERDQLREALEKKLDTLIRLASDELVPVDYEEGVRAVAHAVRETLAATTPEEAPE